MNTHMNQKGFANIILVVVIVILVGAVGYFAFVKKSEPIAQQPTPTPTQTLKDETKDWKTFSLATEGFTLKYPNDWTVENNSNSNCGHVKLNGSDCRDRYDFVSPDGVRVRYVIHKDENSDRISCGTQSICWSDNVLDLERLNIQNFSQVYLVKLDKQVRLHKSLSEETTPKVGENKHSNFGIDFSLPSKTGGRYNLFITTSFAGYEPTQLQNITSAQFYNLKSVQQGILILKSLHY